MFLIIILCAILGLFEYLSIRYATRGIAYKLRFSKRLVDPDEILTMTSIIENRSMLPKMYIRLSETIPYSTICQKDAAGADIIIDEEEDASDANSDGFDTRFDVQRDYVRVSTTLYVMPRQRVEKELDFCFKERGCYKFLGAGMLCGDFLGISNKASDFELNEEIVVAPRAYEDTDLKTALGGMLGMMSVRRFIFEDPVLTIGAREYTGREPMKSISWTLSARSTDIMVKVYDYTLEPTAAVILNMECDSEVGRDKVAGCLEKALSVARTVCETLDGSGIKYSFYTNARASGAENIWPVAKDGLGPGHLSAILEGLGRANYYPNESCFVMLDKVVKRAEPGRTHIFITPEITEVDKPGIERLKLVTGSDVLVIETLERKPGEGRFVWKW